MSPVLMVMEDIDSSSSQNKLLSLFDGEDALQSIEADRIVSRAKVGLLNQKLREHGIKSEVLSQVGNSTAIAIALKDEDVMEILNIIRVT